MVYVLLFCAWPPGAWHSNILTYFCLGAWPWVAWPPGSWHSNTVTSFFFFFRLALGDRQPPDSSGRGNLLPLFQFSFNPKQNPGVFFHFLVLLFSFPGAFFCAPDCAFAGAFVCAPDCAFAGAFFCAPDCAFAGAFFCAPDCAFAGAFFCAPDCAFAGVFFVLLIVLLLVLFLCS